MTVLAWWGDLAATLTVVVGIVIGHVGHPARPFSIALLDLQEDV